MEVHELKNFMDQRFELLDRTLNSKFTAIDLCIEKLDKRVTIVDRWVWFMRGSVAIIAVLAGWIGFRH